MDAIITVASDDATPEEKAAAHYVCTGKDDHETINQALQESLRVELTGGNYYFGDSVLPPPGSSILHTYHWFTGRATAVWRYVYRRD